MPRCLIADDSKTMRMLLIKIMENFGYTVEEAEDGEDLLEQCTADMPDLIISDWNLPLIDGIDVLYKIRSNQNIRQPVFLFCSYIKDTEIIRQALKGGADDFIMRPFDEDIIAQKLRIIKFMKGVK
ncbi:MAG: response regulator [bacterium]|nr:response regulator [bacterium]MDY2829957.1 response regulator [Alphaproteobacteria bacterium]